MLGPEVVQREADERFGSTGDDALSFLTIHEIPGFAIGSRGVREGAMKPGLELATAPDALLGQGDEGEGRIHVMPARCWMQMRDQLSSESRSATRPSSGWKARS